MRIAVEKDPSLPPLAWCAKLTRGDDVVRLACGSSVQARGDAFFEGAWAGQFADMGFDNAADVLGSGGRVRDGALVVVPPSHTCDRVQFLRKGGGGATETLFVSNSLSFLLRAAGERLDPGYARYAHDFTRIIYGLRNYRTEVPTRSGARVTLVYYRNVRVTPDLQLEYVDKPVGTGFASFKEYVDALAGTIRQVSANAANPSRAGGGYRAVTGCSAGYDSPAVAVLATRSGGCRRAVTFMRSRDDGQTKGTDDSGKPIADVLKLDLQEFARDDFKSAPGTPELEFFASGMSGEDVIMKAFEPALAKGLYFTGFNGGKVWDKTIEPDDQLGRKDLSGASLTEFRLRIDFVHFPVPFSKSRHQPDLHRISNTPEMATWSIGGDYDRPIPRRIVEEAGVPRGAFGTAKRAASSLIHLRLLEELSPESRASLLRFRDGLRLSPVARLKHLADAKRHDAAFFAMRALRKLGLLKYVPPVANTCFAVHTHSWLGPAPMIWAIETVGEQRYAAGAMKLAT